MIRFPVSYMYIPAIINASKKDKDQQTWPNEITKYGNSL